MTNERFWAIIDFNYGTEDEYTRIIRWAKALIALYE